MARSWVGDKESELATAAVNAAAAAAILKANYETDKRAALDSGVARAPDMPSGSIPATAPAKAPKPRPIRSQPGPSVNTSRAASIASDAVSHAPRPPTKMRTMLAGPASEAGNDSDMAAPGS